MLNQIGYIIFLNRYEIYQNLCPAANKCGNLITMSFHIIGKADNLIDAIDQLRPEFAIADQLHPIIRESARCNTYFATIPTDIVNIIITYVGKSRCRTDLEIIDISAHNWREFFKKYSIDTKSCVFDLSLLKRDYPDKFQHIHDRYIVYIKNVCGDLLVVQGLKLRIGYLGSGQYITSMDDKCILYPSGKPFGTPGAYYTPLYILPCGLVVLSEDHKRKNRELLYDPSANTAIILPHISSRLFDQFIDDFAQEVVVKDHTPACTWNELSCWFITCMVREPSAM